jgi:hypothetical protein
MINTTRADNNGESQPQESLRGPRELTADELYFSAKVSTTLPRQVVTGPNQNLKSPARFFRSPQLGIGESNTCKTANLIILPARNVQ